MLLVTVNPKQKKTTMISIPRDSYTEIIGYGTFDKLNHAYAFGKEQFSINSVQNMLNVPIDYYVTVDMNGLIGLVDAVGGLQITPNLTFTYEEEYFEEGIIRHVDGEAALRYSRMRYDDPEGDIGRQKRQQYIIQKLVEKLLSLNSITKYEEILQTLENSVKTNFTVEKLFQVAQTHKEALQHFDSHTISGNGAMINGIYYFVIPEQEKLRISNVLRKSLDLETIDVLKHIETKEVQSSVNIEQNTPQRNTDVEEPGETYVEPNVTPIRPNEKETTVSPMKQNPTTISTTVVPVTELPNVTAVPELPNTQVPTTQEIPTTREVVAPAQPSTDPKP
jgi:membrane-bound protein lytR